MNLLIILIDILLLFMPLYLSYVNRKSNTKSIGFSYVLGTYFY